MTSAPTTPRTLRVAVLGCGNVGAALVGILQARADALAVQSGARLELAGIAVGDLGRARPDHVPTGLLTGDPAALVADPTVDIVVELMGGLDPAGDLVRAALDAGRPVVTANKALLASPDGVALRTLARERGVDLLYEAAVAGAIPLVRALRESLTGERIHRVMGIVNGTTNFILTKMGEEGTDYATVLAEAQALGLAERDPTADVEGFDAAAKAAILAGVAFGYDVSDDAVVRTGITGIRAEDADFARRSGHVIKLLAVVERSGGDGLSVRVHPALVPSSHPLAGVRDAFNAVFIEGEAAGELMLYGQGAGGLPTASAVVGDLIDASRNLLAGTTAPAPDRQPARLVPAADLEAGFYVSLDVADRPGVLGAVTTAFGAHGVSIRSVEQAGGGAGARLDFVTHVAREGDLEATLADLERLDAVERIGGVLRIVGGVVTAAGRALAWRGVIEEYREFLPVDAGTPVVSLLEGGTPLLEAPRLSERVGARVLLKIEGANPTGSFKDRGMTMAISKAVEEGAKAVVCASTGNTSASAAAFSARAGLTCAVLIPEGHIALGKLAQALIHGATVLQLRGNFDQALDIVRDLGEQAPVTVVNSVNPYRIEGQKSGAFEIVDQLGDAPEVHCIPVGNAGNITAYWKGYLEFKEAGRSTRLPRMLGFQAAGAAPIVAGHPIEHPETVATAIRIGNPASWYGATSAASESGGGIAAVTDDQILEAYRFLATEESVFCEPASAASVAGLLTHGLPDGVGATSTVVCVLTGHGLKDPDIAISQIRVPTVVDADLGAVLEQLGL